MIASVTNLWRDEGAVTTVEYALLLTTIVAASIGAWTSLGESVRNTVSDAAAQLTAAGR